MLHASHKIVPFQMLSILYYHSHKIVPFQMLSILYYHKDNHFFY